MKRSSGVHAGGAEHNLFFFWLLVHHNEGLALVDHETAAGRKAGEQPTYCCRRALKVFSSKQDALIKSTSEGAIKSAKTDTEPCMLGFLLTVAIRWHGPLMHT